MAKTVRIDEDECIGCEACVEGCPSVFAFNDDEGKAYVIEGAEAGDDCVDEAIANCPAACITWE
ncbi:ferredoxin [Desulfofustis limnaeus]|jgi:ferredoxin|uniref:Ferredoxin n=1 Tax=Desulfofustis limnaeus TaxID=2740163 RepID=A0ABM7W4S0_9BACT|nr:ferredoxin [Desulfofustis limnaeus]MDX9894044.1 ferredoxin [Desulfofustis sp.]BDD85902.1 4Fe-4S ferredoxin [Desulfofustis limnaeus]